MFVILFNFILNLTERFIKMAVLSGTPEDLDMLVCTHVSKPNVFAPSCKDCRDHLSAIAKAGQKAFDENDHSNTSFEYDGVRYDAYKSDDDFVEVSRAN